MQSPSAKPLGATRFCWICGKTLFAGNRIIDEHGNAVHYECFEARNNLKKAASSEAQQPKTIGESSYLFRG